MLNTNHMELIGYQVVSRDGKNNIPDDLYSFEVVSKRVAAITNFHLSVYDLLNSKLMEFFTVGAIFG